MATNETPMTSGQKLRFLTGGKRRADIEKAAGLKPGDLSCYINREYLPPPHKLLILCRVLNCSMEWLCDPKRGIVVPEDARSHAA
jgi:hypothetical protein